MSRAPFRPPRHDRSPRGAVRGDVAAAARRPALLLPLFFLLGLLVSGCASGPIDYATAVEVRVVNPTPMRVWVQFERSAGGATWTRSVGPHRENEYLVRHRAFGHGPVRMKLIRWPGALHLTKVYGHRGKLTVPPGSLIEVRLARDLRETTVWTAESRPRPGASAPSSPDRPSTSAAPARGSPAPDARPRGRETRPARPPRGRSP